MNVQARLAARRASHAKHYAVLLVFVREWTNDTVLVGLRYEDDIPFHSAAAAEAWVRNINAKNANGKMNYKVVDHVVVGLAKDLVAA